MATKYNAFNLGQGFPNWETPEFVKQAVCAAIIANSNQYCRSPGENSLVSALSSHYSPLIGRTLNPLSEINVSVGATGALFGICQAHINPGDEVVIIEPSFDIYPAQVQVIYTSCMIRRCTDICVCPDGRSATDSGRILTIVTGVCRRSMQVRVVAT